MPGAPASPLREKQQSGAAAPFQFLFFCFSSFLPFPGEFHAWLQILTEAGTHETGRGTHETGVGTHETASGTHETGNGTHETGEGTHETGKGPDETGILLILILICAPVSEHENHAIPIC